MDFSDIIVDFSLLIVVCVPDHLVFIIVIVCLRSNEL